MYKISDFWYIDPCYTGGNIYIYTGQMKDGTYFLADDCNYFVDFIDVNPDDYDEDGLIPVEVVEEHRVGYIDDDEERFNFFKVVYEWVIRYQPHTEQCNYNVGDMEDRLEYLSENFY